MSSLILDEEYDEAYEPTPEEILEYAQFLGMDGETDKDLFWIARESLKAPLPENWKPCSTDDGTIYYFNFVTGESLWDHPCDEHYRKLYETEKAKKTVTSLQDAKSTPVSESESKSAPDLSNSSPPLNKPTIPQTNTAPAKPALIKHSSKASEPQELNNDIDEDINEDIIVNDKEDELDSDQDDKKMLPPPSRKDFVSDVSSPMSSKSSVFKPLLKPLTSVSSAVPSIKVTQSDASPFSCATEKDLKRLPVSSTPQPVAPLKSLASNVDLKSDLTSDISIESKKKSICDDLPPLPIKKAPLSSASTPAQPQVVIDHDAIKRKIALETEAIENAARQAHEAKIKQLQETLAEELQEEESKIKAQFQQRTSALRTELEVDESAARIKTAETIGKLNAERQATQNELEALHIKHKQEVTALQNENQKILDKIRNEFKRAEEEESRKSQDRLSLLRKEISAQVATAQSNADTSLATAATEKKTGINQELCLLEANLKEKRGFLNDIKEEYDSYKQQNAHLAEQLEFKRKQLTVIVEELGHKENELSRVKAAVSASLEELDVVKQRMKRANSTEIRSPPMLPHNSLAPTSSSASHLAQQPQPSPCSNAPSTAITSGTSHVNVANPSAQASQVFLQGYGVIMGPGDTDADSNPFTSGGDKTIPVRYSVPGVANRNESNKSLNITYGGSAAGPSHSHVDRVREDSVGNGFARMMNGGGTGDNEKAICAAVDGRAPTKNKNVSSGHAAQNPLSAILDVRFSTNSINDQPIAELQRVSSSQRAFLDGYGMSDTTPRGRESQSKGHSHGETCRRASVRKPEPVTTPPSRFPAHSNVNTQTPPPQKLTLETKRSVSKSRSPSRSPQVGTVDREWSPRPRKRVEALHTHSPEGKARRSRHSPTRLLVGGKHVRPRLENSSDNIYESDSASSTTSSSMDDDDFEESNHWTPSKQINRRLRRDERHIRASKRSLRKEAKTIQREEANHFYGVSQQRARIEELAAKIDRENDVRMVIANDLHQQVSRYQSLDAVEAEIEKVLTKLRSSRDTSVSRMHDMMQPPETKTMSSYTPSHTAPPRTIWSPTPYYSTSVRPTTVIGQTATSETRKHAWDISRAKTERELDMHSQFLRRLVARKQSTLNHRPTSKLF
ncbi:hypothetical protein SeMB42_g07641 [Synchytrium endobioticum]|uniref:WW domain-containing protein n=1 Tax=Synchytrium endobioticum TaxID=286115 RepID=A0A507C2C9_9FUNG|nr:hypothetical protein SeMB42_g07641 [Synchytrium endobioticum]